MKKLSPIADTLSYYFTFEIEKTWQFQLSAHRASQSRTKNRAAELKLGLSEHIYHSEAALILRAFLTITVKLYHHLCEVPAIIKHQSPTK